MKVEDFDNFISTGKWLTIAVDSSSHKHYQLLDIWCKANDCTPEDLETMREQKAFSEQDAVNELQDFALESVIDILEQYPPFTIPCGNSEIKMKLDYLTDTDTSVTWGFSYEKLKEKVLNGDSPASKELPELSQKLEAIIGCVDCKATFSGPKMIYGEPTEPSISISFKIPYLDYVRGKGNGRGRRRDPDSVEEKTKGFAYNSDFDDMSEIGELISKDIENKMRYAFDRSLVSGVNEEAAQWVKEHPFEGLSSSQITQINNLVAQAMPKVDYNKMLRQARTACNRLIPSIIKELLLKIKTYKLGELEPLLPFIIIQDENEPEY